MNEETVETLREIADHIGAEANDLIADLQEGGTAPMDDARLGKYGHWVGKLMLLAKALSESQEAVAPIEDIQRLTSCVSIVHWRKDAAYADDETMDAAARVERWLGANGTASNVSRAVIYDRDEWEPVANGLQLRATGDTDKRQSVGDLVFTAIRLCKENGAQPKSVSMSVDVFRQCENEFRAVRGERRIGPKEDIAVGQRWIQGLPLTVVIGGQDGLLRVHYERKNVF